MSTELQVTTSPDLAVAQGRAVVHDAVRDQLVYEIGRDRLEKLDAVVDPATFDAVLHWLSGGERSSLDTKRRYAEDLTAFAEWAALHLGCRTVSLLSVLTFETITTWTIYARSQGLAARSQRRILSAVSSLFKHTAPRGWSSPNPVSFRSHAPKVGTSTTGRPAGATRVLPADEAVRMGKAARTAEERLTFDLLYLQGLRESEVVNLMAENVDRNQSPAVLNFQRKGGQWKQRILPAATLRHLDDLLDVRDDGPVLIDPKTGGARNRHQLIDLTRRLARRAEIPNPQGVTPHVLRAAAITALLNGGSPLQQVQKWADHAHATTTQGYWERSNGLQRDAELTGSLASMLSDEDGPLLGGGE
jgi:site-specific recombinase XerD